MWPSPGILSQAGIGVSTAAGPTIVKGMNWRMLPRLPCSRHSTHSSMNHWTNWVWVPAVLAPKMEEMSRKRFAVGTGRDQQSGHFWEAEWPEPLTGSPVVGCDPTDPSPPYPAPGSAGPSC